MEGRNTLQREGDLRSLPLKAGVTALPGILMMAVAGVARPGAASASAVALGRCEAFAEGGASDGEAKVQVRTGTFCWKNSATDPVTLADIGKPVFIEDDRTVAKTSATNTLSPAGTLFDVDAEGVWVTTR